MFSPSVKHISSSGNVMAGRVGGWKLPYDAEVEYIEAHDGQYIDTMISVIPNTIIEARWYQVGNSIQQRLFGVNDGSRKVFACYINNNTYWAANTGTSSGGAIIAVTANTDYTGTFNLGTGVCKINGTSRSHGGTPFSSTNTIPLFQRKNVGVVQTNYPATMRLYWFKITQDNILVADFIPVRIGSEYCLYNRMDPTGGENGDGLYHNKGTGNFWGGADKPRFKPAFKHYDIAVSYTINECNGSIPIVVNANFPSDTYSALDYTPTFAHHRFVGWYDKPYDAEIEYLESSATQWIDTEINDRGGYVECDLTLLNADGTTNWPMCFGKSEASLSPYYPYRFGFYCGKASSNKPNYEYGYGSKSYTRSFPFNFSIEKSQWKVTKPSSQTDWLDRSIRLFSSTFGCPSNTKIRTFKLWNTSNQLRRDFIPIRVGTTGALYDRVTGITFWNSGTGEFVKGTDTVSFNTSEILPSDSIVFDRKDVYARWQPPTTVKFDASANGGEMPSGWTSPDYYVGQPYGELPLPTKADSVFTGWYNASDVKVTEDSIVTADITLTAKYEAIVWGTSYSCTTTSAYKNTGISYAARDDASKPIVVDWGDGSTETIDGNINTLAHTYSSIGTFTVKISDNITSFAPSNYDFTWYNTTSQNRYTFKEVLTLSPKISELTEGGYYYCQNMLDVIIPSGVTTIPKNCFYYCSSLKSLSETKTITIPATCTSIKEYAFEYCWYIIPTFEAGSSSLSLGSYSFSQCGRYPDSNVWTLDLSPRNITRLPNNCFEQCYSLNNIVWPQNLTSIGQNAFRECFYYAGATGTVDIPEGVNSLGNAALSGCAGLLSVTLPSTMNTIYNYVFSSCSNLATITCKGSSAPSVPYSSAFGNGATSYTGRNSYDSGANRLIVPSGASGYDTGAWLDPLCDSTKCGFTLVYDSSLGEQS